LFHTLTRRLSKIEDHIVLYPGHNYGGSPSGEMGDVRESNSYLKINSLDNWLSIMGR